MVCNSHGGLGRVAWDWLSVAFQRKADSAVGTASKRAVRLEFEASVAEISVAVLRRNAMIMAMNATPQTNAQTPLPPLLLTEVPPDDIRHEGV